MKNLNLFAAMMLSSAVAMAQFEGSYVLKMERPEAKNEKQGMEMKFTVKGDKATMEFLNPEMSKNIKKNIMDRKAKTMIMLMDNEGNKMAMKKALKDFKVEGNDAEKPKITETGKTKVIDGYTCRQVLIENSESNTEVWVTSELPLTMTDVLGYASAARSPRGGDTGMKELYLDKGISLETTVIRKKDNDKTVMHIKEIKKFSVPDSQFSTEGYQVMEMPQMDFNMPQNR